MLEPLAAKLDSELYCLQFDYTKDLTDVTTIADGLLPVSKFQIMLILKNTVVVMVYCVFLIENRREFSRIGR